MATLWNLPTEIVIIIMKQSPNISCLWSLINTSPRFKSIFMTFAREIVDEVLTKTTPGCTQILMKMNLAVATRTSLDLFVGYSGGTSNRSRKKLFGQPIHREMPPQALYDFVEAAHTVHGIAHACLDSYIKNSLSAKPERISDNDLRDWHKTKRMVYSERRTSGQSIQPKDFGPPTYLEEQRVIRTLWQLQLFLEMKSAHRRGALAHWSEEDHAHLKMVADIPEMTRFSRDSEHNTVFSSNMEQIISVIDYINEITKDEHGSMEDVLTRFLHHPPLAVCNKAYRLPCCGKPTPESEEVNGETFVRDIDNAIQHRAIGCSFYVSMTRNKEPPLKNISFKPWRRLGFAFWQAERLIELGFMPAKSLADVLTDPHGPWFTWRSILTPEEDIERRVMRPHHSV